MLLYALLFLIDESVGATECLTHRHTTNDCSETATDWNLGISTGAHSDADTNAAIIFRYCINEECRPWYRLDHCDHNDFEGSCTYEYFVIPEFDEAISDALDNNEDDFRFEFVNCDTDGLQIDEITIAVDFGYQTIKFFDRADDKFCNWNGFGECSFVIDGNGECNAVSVRWNGNAEISEAKLYSTLTESIDYSEICNQAKMPNSCAEHDDGCAMKPIRPFEGIDDMTFGGNGYYDCDTNGNCEYVMSLAFQKDICDADTMILKNLGGFGKWLDKIFRISSTEWCAQGISEYGDYVTRVFYEGGGPDYTDYVAISVVKKGNAVRYSNILVAQPENGKSACHAGDTVLTQIDGEYWFLVACSSWIMVFSEKSIEPLLRGYEVNQKKFYYRVSKDNVKSIFKNGYDISLSWISRNQGTNNEFWTGKCESDLSMVWCAVHDCNLAINIKLITLDVGNTWEITKAIEYSMSDKNIPLNFIQGATRIGHYMYFSKTDISPVWNNLVWRCPITGTEIGTCEIVCKLTSPTMNFIQGAEVDKSGNLYVGSEYGILGRRAPWYILQDLESGGLCLPDLFSVEPMPERPEMPEQRPINVQYIEWSYKQIGLIALFGAVMFTFGMSVVISCNKNNKHKYYSSVKTISNDEESDAL